MAQKLELDPTGETFTTVKDQLLIQMKGEEFETTIAQWVSELTDLEVNQKAVERYAVDKIRLG